MALAALLATACGSCAYGYTEADGTRRIIGFVDMEIRPPADPQTIAGEVVDVSTIGLALLDAEDGTSVALGWQRHVAASLRDNAAVLGNPLTAVDRPGGRNSDRGLSNEQ